MIGQFLFSFFFVNILFLKSMKLFKKSSKKICGQNSLIFAKMLKKFICNNFPKIPCQITMNQSDIDTFESHNKATSNLNRAVTRL